MNTKKAIIILSGGLDSTILTYYLMNKEYDLTAITFDYGQRHLKEIECAKKTCEKLAIPHIIINVEEIFSQFKFSALIDKTKDIPQTHYNDESQRITVVPNRNMIMLSIAIGFAEDKQINKVFYAAHFNDIVIYPDCRKEFARHLSIASRKGTYTQVSVRTPFISKTKTDLVKIGNKLEVPFEDTWSCYSGKEKACGLCGTCSERVFAFHKNKLEDLIKYEKPWEEIVKIVLSKEK